MYGCLTFMVSALLVGAIGIEPEKSVCYTVDHVDAVELPTTFTCRLRDYAWPTQVQFKVRLRNLELPPDPNAAEAARRFLYERLTNARQVRLGAVRDHGYFQLTAEVFADGRDVAAEMVEYGLTRSSAVTVETPKHIPVSAKVSVLSGPENPSGAVFNITPVPVSARSQTIGKQLTQKADLSRIGPETTFQEALSIIAEATQPRLPMLILWNDLQRNALVERDMPIGIEGFGRMRLDKALELILKAAAPPSTPLVAVAEGGVLTIATRYTMIEKPRVGVYMMADLLAAPSEDREQQQTGSGGAMNR